MRKTLIVLGCMSLGLAHAQQNGRDHTQHQTPDTRVGINTENPAATLELKKVEGLPATQVQGFLLPHLTQEERNAFTKEALVNGVMIFNTTKNCIDWWDGTNWQCQNGSQKDEHGDEYGKYRATFTYTATADFTKNDCPAGQRGSKVNYTPATPIVGRGVSNTSQEEANQVAEQNAKAEFEILGQENANIKGSCMTTLDLNQVCGGSRFLSDPSLSHLSVTKMVVEGMYAKRLDVKHFPVQDGLDSIAGWIAETGEEDAYYMISQTTTQIEETIDSYAHNNWNYNYLPLAVRDGGVQGVYYDMHNGVPSALPPGSYTINTYTYPNYPMVPMTKVHRVGYEAPYCDWWEDCSHLVEFWCEFTLEGDFVAPHHKPRWHHSSSTINNVPQAPINWIPKPR